MWWLQWQELQPGWDPSSQLPFDPKLIITLEEQPVLWSFLFTHLTSTSFPTIWSPPWVDLKLALNWKKIWGDKMHQLEENRAVKAVGMGSWMERCKCSPRKDVLSQGRDSGRGGRWWQPFESWHLPQCRRNCSKFSVYIQKMFKRSLRPRIWLV